MSQRQPALRPTEPATLVVAGLAAAGVAWLLVSNYYQNLPPMVWPPVLVIAAIAALEAVVAWNLWTRIHRHSQVEARGRSAGRTGRGAPVEPVEPLAVARFAVLAKASSVAGAIFTGCYAGFLPWLLVEAGRLTEAAEDLPPTIGGLAASVALMVVALLLERACRVPDRPDEEDDEVPDDR